MEVPPGGPATAPFFRKSLRSLRYASLTPPPFGRSGKRDGCTAAHGLSSSRFDCLVLDDHAVLSSPYVTQSTREARGSGKLQVWPARDCAPTTPALRFRREPVAPAAVTRPEPCRTRARLRPACRRARTGCPRGSTTVADDPPIVRYTSCTPAADWGSPSLRLAAKLLAAHNRERSKRHLSLLLSDPALTRAAQWKALRMAAKHEHSHADLNPDRDDTTHLAGQAARGLRLPSRYRRRREHRLG